MRLMEYLRKSFIKGFSLNELSDIINGLKPDYKVINAVPGTLIIEKGSKKEIRVLECVKEYFTSEESGKKIKPLNSRCFYIQKALGIRGVKHGDCKSCFLKCLSGDSSKTVSRIIK